jgi:BirA family biotin operon repressor/biotin-[acetyl-CoA-carboxylase] ligase
MAWPEGTARRDLDRIDSTNAEAARRAAAGEAGPLWLLARDQTGGRGRRGRAWQSPPGSFAGSLLYRPPGTPAEAALRSFAAALAVRDALVSLGVPGGRLALKWPNDVLLDGRKLAGILLESPQPGTLVVGIGVNLAEAPPAGAVEPGATPPVGLRPATGLAVSPAAFLDALAPAFAAREAALATLGFEPTRRSWLAHAARLGAPVTARLSEGPVAGIFETLDASGALVLGTPVGRRLISAADIQFA